MGWIVEVMATGLAVFMGLVGLLALGITIWKRFWNWALGYLGDRAR